MRRKFSGRTLNEIREDIDNNRCRVGGDALARFVNCAPGNRAYWKRQLNLLQSMYWFLQYSFDQAFTIFCTLRHADLHCKDLHMMLRKLDRPVKGRGLYDPFATELGSSKSPTRKRSAVRAANRRGKKRHTPARPQLAPSTLTAVKHCGMYRAQRGLSTVLDMALSRTPRTHWRMNVDRTDGNLGYVDGNWSLVAHEVNFDTSTNAINSVSDLCGLIVTYHE